MIAFHRLGKELFLLERIPLFRKSVLQEGFSTGSGNSICGSAFCVALGRSCNQACGTGSDGQVTAVGLPPGTLVAHSPNTAIFPVRFNSYLLVRRVISLPWEEEEGE